jgi:hypothetical protein
MLNQDGGKELTFEIDSKPEQMSAKLIDSPMLTLGGNK